MGACCEEERNNNNTTKKNYISEDNDKLQIPNFKRKLPEKDINKNSKNIQNRAEDFNRYNLQNKNEIYSKEYGTSSKLDLILKKKGIIIQDTFFENINDNQEKDKPYLELKKYEKQVLIEEFLNKHQIFLDYLKNASINLSSELKSNESYIYQNNNIIQYNRNFNLNSRYENINNNQLITGIIKNENVENVFINKIINELKEIKKNKERCKLEYLTILLVGQSKIGKRKLIKYMLKLNKLAKYKKNNFFQVFKSDNVKNLQLIKYKGIGYGDNNDAYTIKNNTINFILGQQNKGNYNDFIHCIWYCIHGDRFQKVELEYLLELKKVYSNNCMPIIFVYLNGKISKKFEDYIKSYLEDAVIVDIMLEEKIKVDGTKETASGGDILFELTINKLRESLSGNMQQIMLANIKNDIKKQLSKKNEEIKNKIIQLNKSFINKYSKVNDDREFIDNLISIIGRRIKFFLNENINISNTSLNLIKNSFIIRTILDFMNDCKNKIGEIIQNIVNEKANLFLTKQIVLEKFYSTNININNKRTLMHFRKTNELFLMKNFYFIAQKHILKVVLEFCQDYNNNFYNKLIGEFNEITGNLLIRNDFDETIQNLFYLKLKNLNYFVDLHHNKNDNIIFPKIEPSNISLEVALDLDDINDKSFNIDLTTTEEKNYTDNEKIDLNNSIQQVYFSSIPLKNKTILGKEMVEVLNDYLLKNFEFFSDLDCKGDNLLAMVNNFIEEDLKLFCKNNHENFIFMLDEYHKQNFNKNNFISFSNLNEKDDSKFLSKIKRTFDNLKNDKSFAKIDYLSCLLTGKSGAGKSTLINALLKEELAPTGEPEICTLEPKPYHNKKVKFLKLFDTRGVELIPEYGNDNILRDIENIISNVGIFPYGDNFNYYNNNNLNYNMNMNMNMNNQYLNNINESLEESNEKIELEPLNYNDYIQCIWYCVSNENKFDNQDINFINSLNSRLKNISVIIVCTKSIYKEDIKKTEEDVKKHFKKINFHYLLAKEKKNVNSYGLEELIYKTIEQYKIANNCKIFNDIKKRIKKEVIREFKNENKKRIKNMNEKIAKYVINNFNKIIEVNMFDKYILNFILNILNAFVSIEEIQKLSHININKTNAYNNKSLLNYINKYTEFYKSITKKLIDAVKEKKAINYLNIQSIIEKNSRTNINVEYKCNSFDFIQKIEKILTNCFYHMAQRYFLYQFIVNYGCFAKEIGMDLNNILISILEKPDNEHYFKEIYQQKVKDIEKKIRNYYKN